MNITVNMQVLTNRGSGIATFGKEILKGLVKEPNLKLVGIYNYKRIIKNKEELNTFNIPFRISPIPYKLIYGKNYFGTLPFSYDRISNNRADVNLFFTYSIPRVHYNGLVISTIHDMIPLKTEMENRKIKKRYLDEVKYTASKSDYIITVSESSKKDLVDMLNVKREKIIVIPNGVNFSDFNIQISEFDRVEISRKYHLPDHYILYMGGIRKHKNLENLIISYSQLSSDIRGKYKLVITQGSEKLSQIARNIKIENDVIFTPFVDECDKIAVYKMATIFAFISSYEGFGIPIIEAQAAGVPVITSSISSMPEVSGDGALLVNPHNIEEISSNIENLLLNANLRNTLTTKGLENAKRYSWSLSASKLVDFLNSIKHEINKG